MKQDARREKWLTEPLWLLLLDKWSYILYQRDKVFPNHDFSGNILEIGCGRRGWFSLMVKSYFEGFVVTTDALRDKVRKAKDIAVSLGLASDEYMVVDAVHLPFQQKSFQKIIGNAVLHHILPFISVVAKELQYVMENQSEAIFTGEIVASRFLGWVWKKVSLEKIEGEGIATEGTWRKAFSNVGFKEIKILREQRHGYHTSTLRNLYYLLLKHLPERFVVRHLLSSITIHVAN